MDNPLRSPAANHYARNALQAAEAPPPINVRFFYTSPLAIDDPLSPVPPPLTGSSAAYRAAPRPFSKYDNLTLAKTWSDTRRKLLKISEQVESEKTQSRRGTIAGGSAPRPVSGIGHQGPVHNGKRMSLAGSIGSHRLPQSPRQRPVDTPLAESLGTARRGRTSLRANLQEASPAASPRALDPAETTTLSEPGSLTGNPFIRAPERQEARGSEPRTRSPSCRPMAHPLDSYDWGDELSIPNRPVTKEKKRMDSVADPFRRIAKVPVGVSRLHSVILPDLKMEPIYWLPVHDIAPVIRGTWFYADNLLPVEVDVAIMLEAGYASLRPWTETWADELNSAVEVGAVGEMKILYKLWPEKSRRRSTIDAANRPASSRNPETMSIMSNIMVGVAPDAEEEQKEIVADAGVLIDISTGPEGADNKAYGENRFGKEGNPRKYRTAGIIYANKTEAYILKPSLQPSDYYGRRPLANYIRKGRKIGIRVVRGFDDAQWDKLHPSRKSQVTERAKAGVSTSQAGEDLSDRRVNDETLADSPHPEVSDLVLVIHGIGQKLSERMESYHFTHAINSFRRDVNVELGTPVVKANLRSGVGGIMVLPVNWRLNLSFEEGGYRDDQDFDRAHNDYTLKDITPEGLSSVRGIVSDVMLDIPYYLSNEHRPKMIAAVAQEANRIYRLWCANNPAFEKQGRVHLIAHSLGSVMAIDILSSQPSYIEPGAEPCLSNDVAARDLPSDHFIFNVTHLFTPGSPCGFFLLLKNANLLPRRDTQKQDADEYDSTTPGVAGERGDYGCLAVANVYNIINPYDPVAYHLNACIDAAYASTLKPAFVPSSASPFFNFSNPFRSTATIPAAAGHAQKKPPIPRLPSTVELDTHDFSREEIAEKRALLLNDNGQVDYLLKYGGGPLEIQYLTMLGAHSSYWISRDFVRFVVQEVGRGPGRAGTIPGMRAVKKKGGVAGGGGR